MVKRWYWLNGMSVTAAGKCTDITHHSVNIDAGRTWVGRHVQSAVMCFKRKSLWLDTYCGNTGVISQIVL